MVSCVYKITDKLREYLKQPLGRLLETSAALEVAKNHKGIICAVGDECIYNLLEAGARPQICLYDNLTMRKEVEPHKKQAIAGYCKSPVHIENQAGTISDGLCRALEKAFEKEESFIEVAGEEDLAVLPAMVYSKKGSIILYGQPNQGMVLIEGGSKARETAARILAMFEKA
ncbi:DUF359 domain-containing protein [Candidatus Parvarchaeota archaeon]|nr:DUF359 domain-containing protein [Candidatus Parvarchaeota archaeon]